MATLMPAAAEGVAGGVAEAGAGVAQGIAAAPAAVGITGPPPAPAAAAVEKPKKPWFVPKPDAPLAYEQGRPVPRGFKGLTTEMKLKNRKWLWGWSFFTLAVGISNMIISSYMGATSSAASCWNWLLYWNVGLGAFNIVAAPFLAVGAVKQSPLSELIGDALIAALAIIQISIAITAFTVTNREGVYNLANVAYPEYYFEGFSSWMQSHLNSSWSSISSCIKGANHCSGVTVGLNGTAHFSQNLNAIQGGCCYAPALCYYNTQFLYDCAKYSAGNYTDLCYNCNSCKAAFAHEIRDEWFNVAIGMIIMGFLQLFGLLGVIYIYHVSLVKERRVMAATQTVQAVNTVTRKDKKGKK